MPSLPIWHCANCHNAIGDYDSKGYGRSGEVLCQHCYERLWVKWRKDEYNSEYRAKQRAMEEAMRDREMEEAVNKWKKIL